MSSTIDEREFEESRIPVKPRVLCFQPALPFYRVDFFERCFGLLEGRFTVYYSPFDLHGLETASHLQPRWATTVGPIRGILPGLQWQKGALGVSIRRGDVVIVNGEARRLSNLAVLAKARLFGAQTIWWGHYWSSTSQPWRYALRLVLMRLSHSVVFYTDREVEECRHHLGRFAPVHMLGLNNGINVDPVIACRRTYEAVERGRRLLFVGRLTEKADVRLLLQALASPLLEDVMLDVIGGGPEEVSLQGRVQALELGGRVTWHGAITKEADIAHVANRCALFVYPGSVGLSLIHGMTYGLPAVVHANRWHHMPEIGAFIPSEHGLTFEEGSATSLAETISDALSNPARLKRMSNKAIETVRKSFNTSNMAERIVTEIKRLLDVSL